MNINLILKWMSFCFPTYLLISDVHGTCKTLLSSIQLIFSWLNYKNELWNQDLQWTLTLYVTNLCWFAFWANNFFVFAIYFCRFFLPWKCQISSVFFLIFLKNSRSDNHQVLHDFQLNVDRECDGMGSFFPTFR